MRTALIVLALIALTCADASQEKRRSVRNRGNLMPGAGRALGRARGRAAAQARHHTIEHRASMARFIVHNAKSMSLGTKTPVAEELDKFVGVNVQLATDVINGESSGTPYVYMRKDDFSEFDLQHDNHGSMLFSRVDVDNYCDDLPLYAKDPFCARALLLGKITHVTNATENAAALKSLTDKYRGFKKVNPEEYTVVKMNVEVVLVRGEDGKPEKIPLDMYLAASPDYTEDPLPSGYLDD